MLRLGGRLAVLAVVLGLIAAPAFLATAGTAGSGYEPTTITDYRATYTVAGNGDMRVVEVVSVDFPTADRHGIFRFWDTWDRDATFKRRIPHDLEIRQDGRPAAVAMSTESGGRYRVARIGDADRFVPTGVHVYEISYEIRGVIESGHSGSASQVLGTLVPGGWAQRIRHAEVRLDLPAPATGVRCAVGQGSQGGCQASGEGTRRLTVAVQDLPARTPVTVLANLDMPTPDTGDTRLWPHQWDVVFGSHTWVALGIVLLALVAGVTGYRIERRTHETQPAYPVQYAPPEGVGPAQAAYMLTEGLPRTAFVATLLHMSEKGAAEFRADGDGWVITDHRDKSRWSDLDEVSRSVAQDLGLRGGSFSVEKNSVSAGKVLKRTIDALRTDTISWASKNNLMVRAGLGSAGGLAVGAALVAAAVLAIFHPFGPSLWGLVPGLFAVGGLYLLLRGAGTKRTAEGRELWSRLGGFRRMLSTPSSQQRFDFSGRKELYTAYIPWAVAFGVADKWAQKYRTEVGSEPPAPAYFAGYAGGDSVIFTDLVVRQVDDSVKSSISSYEASIAPQSSGTGSGWSGGGGGFSGGGGFGGGGGGSW